MRQTKAVVVSLSLPTTMRRQQWIERHMLVAITIALARRPVSVQVNLSSLRAIAIAATRRPLRAATCPRSCEPSSDTGL